MSAKDYYIFLSTVCGLLFFICIIIAYLIHKNREGDQVIDLLETRLYCPVELHLNLEKIGNVTILVNKSTAELYCKIGPTEFSKIFSKRLTNEKIDSCFIKVINRDSTIEKMSLEFFIKRCFNEGVFKDRGVPYQGDTVYCWKNIKI